MKALALASALSLVLFVSACDTAEGPSLYDCVEEGTCAPRPAPALASISPAPGEALAGVSELVISGSNFVPDSTFVYFNGVRVPVTSVTSTEIRLRAPNMTMPNLKVKVAVLGAEHFSETVDYLLLPAVERIGGLARSNEPFGIATDDDENVYVSLNDAGVSAGIQRIAEGAETPVPYQTTSFQWFELAFNNLDNRLYAARGVQAIFRFPEGGGSTQETWVNLVDRSIRVLALDIDAEGIVWAGGVSTEFYRIGPDKVIGRFPFAGEVRAIEAANGYVYIAGVRGGQQAIWRYPIQGTTLGAEELYYEISGDLTVNALAAAANGNLFLGTDALDPIHLLSPERVLAPFFPDLLRGQAVALRWLSGTKLVASGVRVVGEADSENGLGDVVVVNTLQAGAP